MTSAIKATRRLIMSGLCLAMASCAGRGPNHHSSRNPAADSESVSVLKVSSALSTGQVLPGKCTVTKFQSEPAQREFPDAVNVEITQSVQNKNEAQKKLLSMALFKTALTTVVTVGNDQFERLIYTEVTENASDGPIGAISGNRDIKKDFILDLDEGRVVGLEMSYSSERKRIIGTNRLWKKYESVVCR